MNELQKLMNNISWLSNATFGDGQRNPAIVYHLKNEVDELIDALNYTNTLVVDESVGVGEFVKQLLKTKYEYADCFILLLDSACRFGITAEDLLNLTREKIEIRAGLMLTEIEHTKEGE